MAGQPPEPSFQPSGQDQALTQGRPAWQQPSYNNPPAAAQGGQAGQAGQQGYGAPSYAPQDQSYPAQEQGYPGQDQTYTSLGQGQGQGQDYQAYQGYQPPSYGAQPGQGAGSGASQWQGIAGVQPGAQPRSKAQKGFLGSLFDFSFTSMVTPTIIKVLYVLAAIMWTVFGLGYVGLAWNTGGAGAGIAVLIIIFPIWLLLGLGITRVVLEAFMVVFRMYEELTKIREQGDNRP
jgi:hypothetical protein